MVGMAAPIVPHRGADPLGQGVQVGDQGLDGLALVIGMILQRGVEVVDIRRMVLAMVDLHGLGVDVGLEGPIIIR